MLWFPSYFKQGRTRSERLENVFRAGGWVGVVSPATNERIVQAIGWGRFGGQRSCIRQTEHNVSVLTGNQPIGAKREQDTVSITP